VASKKSACDSVRRKVAGKTRKEIMDAIRTEFDLPQPKRSGKPTRSATGTPKKVK
jgi:hypothetical protein